MATSKLEIKIKALIEGLDDIAKLREAVVNVGAAAVDVGTETKVAESAVESLSQEARSASQTLDSAGTSLDSAANKLTGVAGAANDASASLEQVGGGAESSIANLERVSSATQETAGGLQEVDGAAQEASQGLEDVGAASQGQTSKLQSLWNRLRDIADSFRTVTTESDETDESIGGLGPKFSELSAKFKELTGGSRNVGGALGNATTNLINASGASDTTKLAVSGLVGALKPLAAALIAVAGIKITFDYLKDAANYAGQVETLGITLGVVGENAGYTRQELDEYEAQLKRTGISTEGARDAMIQMMQAGISLSAQIGETTPQVVQLARAAQDLAVVTGENSSATLQRMVTNIQQLDSMGLRYMGLIVDMSAAQQKFADQLGTTAGALTQAQKRQAVLNEVMVQSAKMSGAYELSMESVGKKVGSMKRYVDELALAIGTVMLPAYGAVVDAGTDLLKSLGNVAQGFDESGEVGAQFGNGIKAVIDPLVPIVTKLFEVILKVGGAFAPVVEAVGLALGTLLEVGSDLIDLFVDGTGSIDLLAGTLEVVAGAGYVVADALQLVKAGFNALIGLAATAVSAVAAPLQTITSWIPGLGGVSESIGRVGDSMDELASRSVDSIMEVSEHFSEGESYAYNWAQSMFAASRTMEGSFDPRPVDLLNERIIHLTRAQKENTMTSQQVTGEMAQLSAELLKARDSGELTEAEFAKLSQRLGQVGQVVQDELDAAFKELGTSSSTLATGVSQDASRIVGALRVVAENGNSTAQQFIQEFTDKVTMVKNIAELQQFSDLLAEGRTRWPEASEALQQAQSGLSRQFEEVFQAQLKNISTLEDWNRMEGVIRAMGENGAISISRMNLALQEGTLAVNRLSPAFQTTADAVGRLDVTIEQVSGRIATLDTAISVTAGQLTEAFGRMASGYATLGGQVEQAMFSQLWAVERRYASEVTLIENSTASQASAEQQKLSLLISTEAEKTRILQQGMEEQAGYADRMADIERAALQVRLKSFDAEVAAVKVALEEQGIARDEAERRIKEIDLNRKNATHEVEAKIRQTKIDSLIQIRDRYQNHINTLIAEEERLAARIKSIEEQKAMAKMSTEERIRAIQKSAMGDYERYEANRTDVANFQAKARAAFAKGEHDQAKSYLDQARNAAAELNTTVQEGEKVIISKDQAAKNAEKALRDVLQTQLELFDAEKAGVEQQRNTLIRSTQDVRAELGKVEGDIVSLQEQAKRGTVINIGVNDTDAKAKLKDLDTMVDRRDRLIEVRTDLTAARESLQTMLEDIEAGRTVRVEGDVKDAMDALHDLGDYAEQVGDMQLRMDVSQALAAIGQTQEGIASLNNVQTKQTHTIEMMGEDRLESAQQKLDALGKKDTKALVEFAEKNEGQMDKYVAKITTLDGRTIYTEASMTGNYEAEAEKIEMIHRELGTKVTVSEHNVETNSEDVVELINAAHQEWADKRTQSEHHIQSNAETVATDLQEAMTETVATSQHQITSNADAAKAVVSEALETSSVASTHEVETNADAVREDVDEVLTEKQITSKHDIEGNIHEVKEENREVLEPQEIVSTHEIQSNVEEVAEQLQSLSSYNSTSMHTVYDNVADVLGQIASLQGRNTSSVHTVYVVKEYLFGIGGMVVGSMNPPKRKNDVPRVFAAGGPVLPQDRYPRMTGGTIGGAGNTDSENRTLDLGAFVLRKSAVQKHGAGNLLAMLDKAKTLPKQQSVPASGTSPAMLMPGEIVVDKDTVSRIGLGMLAYLNGDVELKGGEVPHLPLQFANGGLVGKQAPTFITGPLDRPVFGQAFAKGGEVTGPAANVVQVDLRGNKARASVEVKEEDQGSLLELLADLKARG